MGFFPFVVVFSHNEGCIRTETEISFAPPKLDPRVKRGGSSDTQFVCAEASFFTPLEFPFSCCVLSVAGTAGESSPFILVSF